MRWTMINVNRTGQQADAHLIQVDGGKTILIDAGHRNTAQTMLLPYLHRHGIREIDIVFITHPHIDHYGGLEYLLQDGITIHALYFNVPDKEVCDREIPWGCNYQDVLAIQNLCRRYGVYPLTARAGMKFSLGPDATMEILYAFDGVHTPVGRTDINDMSLVMMLHFKKRRFLFTGDLNRKIGGYIAKYPDKIKADVLKVPHHGTEGTVPDDFFSAVSPRYALVPAPAYLWLSKRSARIRNWFAENHVPVFVNGLDGDIDVVIKNTNMEIYSNKRGK